MDTKVIAPEDLKGRPTSPFLRQGIGSVTLPLYPGSEDTTRPVVRRHIDPPLRSRRIAIVGFAESRHDAPYDDPGVEIWTMNQTSMLMPRWDRLIECHSRETIEAETVAMKRVANYLARLQAERDRPIYMQSNEPDIPASVALPVDRLLARFGGNVSKMRATGLYVESALGWLMALAIDKLMAEAPPVDWPTTDAVGEIGVYGFDLTADGEYADQRPNGEFFLGYAAALDIRIVVPMKSALLASNGLYGFTADPRRALLAGITAEHDQRIAELDAEITQRQQTIATTHEELVRFVGMRDQAAWSHAHAVAVARGGSVDQ